MNSILKKLQILEKENNILKSILERNGISYKEELLETSFQFTNNQESQLKSECIVPAKTLSLNEKVELFRSIFRGREDVFARRWHSESTNKSGYQPVCEREWNREYCNKKLHKCSECPNRKFSSLTYEHIYKHIAGKDVHCRDVIGLYPILHDNTCYFLCTDFDDKNCKHGFKNDVLSFINICNRWNISCYIERSRSGNGAHVWIFFSNAIQATKARRLGKMILEEAMENDAYLSFESYDRFFPNQDVLPEGGLGNLVALPLQGQARRINNTVFVNEDFKEYQDQWSFLQTIKTNTETHIDFILRNKHSTIGELTKSNENKPWDTPSSSSISQEDFPDKISIVRANMLYISLKDLSPKVANYFKRIAAFHNPEFYSKQAMRIPTYDLPRIISCSEIIDNYLAIPRGCEDKLQELFTQHNVIYEIIDKTNHGIPIKVEFNGILKEEQKEALSVMLPYNNGTLSATTAFGKTIFAISMIATRKVNTLILVHRRSLLDQWKKQLEEFLMINEVVSQNTKRKNKKNISPIGCLYSGKNSLHGIIDVALIQSCINKNEIDSFVENYGMVIVDECHHVSSFSFEQVLRKVKSKYVYGLTATPIRKDGHQPIIFMQCGKIRYSADAISQMAKQTFARTLIPRFTPFRTISINEDKSYTQIIEEISLDNTRNKLIVKDISKIIKGGRTPIILTSLTSHVKTLTEMLIPHADNVIPLIGADSTKSKRLALERLKNIPINESLIIIATGKYIGEGFDYPRLDTLFLALPISWKGNLAQYAGRLHRDFENKTEVCIYDYIDIRVPLCEKMYRKRLKGYSSIGYGIRNAIENKIEKQDLLFNGRNFLKDFTLDITNAKSSILISCPKTKYKYSPQIISLLKELIRKGINVIIYVNKEGHYEKELKTYGFEVYCNPLLSIQSAILDKSLVWYGNINFFSYNTEENNAMRISDPSIATDLLNVICD